MYRQFFNRILSKYDFPHFFQSQIITENITARYLFKVGLFLESRMIKFIKTIDLGIFFWIRFYAICSCKYYLSF